MTLPIDDRNTCPDEPETDLLDLEEDDEVLTKKDVARWFKISEKHVGVMMHRHQLPHFHVAPRTPRFSKRALERKFRIKYSAPKSEAK